MIEGKGFLRAFAVVLVLTVAFSSSAHAQCCIDPAALIQQFSGYCWEEGTPVGTSGNLVKFVANIDAIFGGLVFDMAVNEYTLYAELERDGDWVMTGSGTDPGSGSDFIEYSSLFLDGGQFETREDASMNSVFSPNPPNADVPSTFLDGTDYLSGQMSFTVMVTQVFTTGTRAGEETGSFSSCLEFTSGSQLPLVGGGNGFTFGGQVSNALLDIPGYSSRATGKVFHCPVSVEESTWGLIKNRYRADD